MMRAALIYLGIVYAAGFGLGVVRGLVVSPRLGEFGAILVEAPVMLAVILGTGIWLARRRITPRTGPARLGMGALAGAGLLGLEMAGGMLLRGQPPQRTIEGWGTQAGLIFLALAAIFVLWPALHGMRGNPGLRREGERDRP